VIALTTAATFAILAVFIPSMGESARGANLIGGLRLAA